MNSTKSGSSFSPRWASLREFIREKCAAAFAPRTPAAATPLSPPGNRLARAVLGAADVIRRLAPGVSAPEPQQDDAARLRAQEIKLREVAHAGYARLGIRPAELAGKTADEIHALMRRKIELHAIEQAQALGFPIQN